MNPATDAEPELLYRGRFAPSPTGSLHLGNARTALVAWVRARIVGGTFIVRVEDLDGPRTRQDAVTGNLDELRWLGLDWDEGPDVGGPVGPYLQSERGPHYQTALAQLVASGVVYDCYLSRKDVTAAASAPHDGDDTGAVYGPRQRALNRSVAAARGAQGRRPSQRLATGGGVVVFDDAGAGRQSFDVATQVGDIVLRRSDGLWAYQLAVVVDDAAMGVTEVVRGSDLLTSTAAQLLVYRALGLEPPRFAHVGLLVDDEGRRLSKRAGALSLGDMKRSGVAPSSVVGVLAASLGWLDSPSALTPRDLLEVVPHQKLVTLAQAPAPLGQPELAYLTAP